MINNNDFKRSPQSLFIHYRHGRTHPGEKPLLVIHMLNGTRENKKEENYMNTNAMKQLSIIIHSLNHTKESIPKPSMNAICVGKSFITTCSGNTR